MAERPSRISHDERGRLHCETGPAIQCRDGLAVYAWHGERIPGEWIESPESITPEIVFSWENLDQRQAAAEIMGWNRILDAVGATVVDRHKNPTIGTLYEAELPGAGRSRILRVECGTGRTFAMPVPESCQTAQAAQDWMWGMGPGAYAPEVRT